LICALGAWYAGTERTSKIERAIFGARDLDSSEFCVVQEAGPTWLPWLIGDSAFQAFDRRLSADSGGPDLKEFCRAPYVALICLREDDITETQLQWLTQAPRLIGIDYSNTHWPTKRPPAHLTPPPLPCLKALSVDYAKPDSASIGRLASLEVLSVSSCEVDQSFLREISKLRKLRELSLTNTRIDPRDLAFLARLPNLERLDLSWDESPEVGDAILEAISAFPAIWELDIAGCNFTAKGSSTLSKLPRLRRLHISGDNLDEQLLSHLASVEPLQQLAVSAKLSQESIDRLRILPRLQELKLTEVGGTDDRDERYSDEERAAIQATIPRCRITYHVIYPLHKIYSPIGIDDGTLSGIHSEGGFF
jgi:hypothetical protein